MKKYVALLLAVFLIFSSLPAVTISAGDSAAFDYGTTGDCTWSIDADYNLTISGNGSMQDYGYSEDWVYYGNTPWNDYIDKIVSVTIDDGVTYIGNQSFLRLHIIK